MVVFCFALHLKCRKCVCVCVCVGYCVFVLIMKFKYIRHIIQAYCIHMPSGLQCASFADFTLLIFLIIHQIVVL